MFSKGVFRKQWVLLFSKGVFRKQCGFCFRKVCFVNSGCFCFRKGPRVNRPLLFSKKLFRNQLPPSFTKNPFRNRRLFSLQNSPLKKIKISREFPGIFLRGPLLKVGPGIRGGRFGPGLLRTPGRFQKDLLKGFLFLLWIFPGCHKCKC